MVQKVGKIVTLLSARADHFLVRNTMENANVLPQSSEIKQKWNCKQLLTKTRFCIHLLVIQLPRSRQFPRPRQLQPNVFLWCHLTAYIYLKAKIRMNGCLLLNHARKAERICMTEAAVMA